MNYGIMAAVIIAAAAGLCLLWRYVRTHGKPDRIDGMEGHEFEYFCAELLQEHGFSEVRVTKGSGDYGVDILAEKDGISYAIQCKAYASPVGVKAVQEAYAGRDYYDCMVGAVLTNQYFTKPAVEAAKKLKILLWDRGYLDEMMSERE
ncbi:MAG: restriction endonuclease [Lachnospiraceae bacterium]|nr:restriction endonuclease [Lachnospiraceae bacterium]MDE7238472.1 restriction endonuclease [Lachnospiraceae bacterium]